MGTKLGTANFVSKRLAIRYFKPQFDEQEVERKIREGEINIGPPTLKEDETLCVDYDGRYTKIVEDK